MEKKNLSENITPRQSTALKGYAKNQEISSTILKGVDIDSLTKQKASSLIQQCIERASNKKNGNSSSPNIS